MANSITELLKEQDSILIKKAEQQGKKIPDFNYDTTTSIEQLQSTIAGASIQTAQQIIPPELLLEEKTGPDNSTVTPNNVDTSNIEGIDNSKRAPISGIEIATICTDAIPKEAVLKKSDVNTITSDGDKISDEPNNHCKITKKVRDDNGEER